MEIKIAEQTGTLFYYWRLTGSDLTHVDSRKNKEFLHQGVCSYELHPSLTLPLKEFCWKPLRSSGSGGHEPPAPLHGPAISLSLLQTLTFWCVSPCCAVCWARKLAFSNMPLKKCICKKIKQNKRKQNKMHSYCVCTYKHICSTNIYIKNR